MNARMGKGGVVALLFPFLFGERLLSSHCAASGSVFEVTTRPLPSLTGSLSINAPRLFKMPTHGRAVLVSVYVVTARYRTIGKFKTPRPTRTKIDVIFAVAAHGRVKRYLEPTPQNPPGWYCRSSGFL